MFLCLVRAWGYAHIHNYAIGIQIDNGQQIQPSATVVCVCALIHTDPPNPFKFLTYTTKSDSQYSVFIFIKNYDYRLRIPLRFGMSPHQTLSNTQKTAIVHDGICTHACQKTVARILESNTHSQKATGWLFLANNVIFAMALRDKICEGWIVYWCASSSLRCSIVLP